MQIFKQQLLCYVGAEHMPPRMQQLCVLNICLVQSDALNLLGM